MRSVILLTITRFFSKYDGFVLNIRGIILNTNGFVLNLTIYALITYPLKRTLEGIICHVFVKPFVSMIVCVLYIHGFVPNVIKYVANIIAKLQVLQNLDDFIFAWLFVIGWDADHSSDVTMAFEDAQVIQLVGT